MELGLTTIYSHEFLVGSFNGNLKHEQLDKNCWKKELVSAGEERKRYPGDRGYNGLCTMYYKAHIDSMLEAENVARPDFLNSVHHYIHDLESYNHDIEGNDITLTLQKGRYPDYVSYKYTFRLCKLHLFFFPLGIVLFAIEIDDTGTELDNMTSAHFKLMTGWKTDSFGDAKLTRLMLPLTCYVEEAQSGKLTKDGNKLKMFQSVKIDTEKIDDGLLYELGSSSPVGCVNHGNRPDMKPSENYFRKIIDENTISTFDNWKGLALMDSFTILGKKDSFYENDCNFLYFPLIYLRCVFEKTFCFSRNNAYRENRADERLTWEIELMEQYYFYDNISYNFQPNMLYQTMAKGLGIKEEQKELVKQIKEREEKRVDKILAYVAFFAVFSVVWDICSICKDALSISENPWVARFFILVGIIVSTILVYQIKNRRSDR